eukprot:SAG22_NODE_855_length_6843_cov_3.865658_4_plen_262_part_00
MYAKDCGASNATRSKDEQFASGRSCWNYPRAWDLHGDGSLVLMTVTRVAAGEAWLDILHEVVVDEALDVPRLRWWSGNERLKGRRLSHHDNVSSSGGTNLTSFSRKGWDLSVDIVLETTVSVQPGAEFGLIIDYNCTAGVAFVFDTNSSVAYMGNAAVTDGGHYDLPRCLPGDSGCKSNIINRTQSFAGEVRLRLLARSVAGEPAATMVTVFVDDWVYGVYTAGVASGRFGVLQNGQVRPIGDGSNAWSMTYQPAAALREY